MNNPKSIDFGLWILVVKTIILDRLFYHYSDQSIFQLIGIISGWFTRINEFLSIKKQYSIVNKN